MRDIDPVRRNAAHSAAWCGAEAHVSSYVMAPRHVTALMTASEPCCSIRIHPTHVERREPGPLAIERVVVVVCRVSEIDHVVAVVGVRFSSSLSLFTGAAAFRAVTPQFGAVCFLLSALQAELARADARQKPHP